jgi:hypothetical protein
MTTTRAWEDGNAVSTGLVWPEEHFKTDKPMRKRLHALGKAAVICLNMEVLFLKEHDPPHPRFKKEFIDLVMDAVENWDGEPAGLPGAWDIKEPRWPRSALALDERRPEALTGLVGPSPPKACRPAGPKGLLPGPKAGSGPGRRPLHNPPGGNKAASPFCEGVRLGHFHARQFRRITLTWASAS